MSNHSQVLACCFWVLVLGGCGGASLSTLNLSQPPKRPATLAIRAEGHGGLRFSSREYVTLSSGGWKIRPHYVFGGLSIFEEMDEGTYVIDEAVASNRTSNRDLANHDGPSFFESCTEQRRCEVSFRDARRAIHVSRDDAQTDVVQYYRISLGFGFSHRVDLEALDEVDRDLQARVFGHRKVSEGTHLVDVDE